MLSRNGTTIAAALAAGRRGLATAAPKPNVGILAMDAYFPGRYVSQGDLEQADGVGAGKYTIGEAKLAPTVVEAPAVNLRLTAAGCFSLPAREQRAGCPRVLAKESLVWAGLGQPQQGVAAVLGSDCGWANVGSVLLRWR